MFYTKSHEGVISLLWLILVVCKISVAVKMAQQTNVAVVCIALDPFLHAKKLHMHNPHSNERNADLPLSIHLHFLA